MHFRTLRIQRYKIIVGTPCGLAIWCMACSNLITRPGIEDDIGKIFQKFRIFSKFLSSSSSMFVKSRRPWKSRLWPKYHHHYHHHHHLHLEMVDGSFCDGVPDILVTWKLKHDISRPYPAYRMGIRNYLSSKDPTWRWWIGSFSRDWPC